MSSRRKYGQHPLMHLFNARRWYWVDGINWLQDHGMIADNCVEVEDVASGDVLTVLTLAALSEQFNQGWLATIRNAYERNLQKDC
jgi:hypothetical protein